MWIRGKNNFLKEEGVSKYLLQILKTISTTTALQTARE